MSSSSSSSYYKDQCSDLKQDLKRKRRELDEAEERCRRSEGESKKAKIESQEILKLYHGIQRELQLAYERNAKLQVDKVSYEGLLDGERKEFDAYKKQQAASSEENKKLKDALCAMRTEKLELETKFNAIVMENKDLRDRARQYEPRLREMDEIKRKLAHLEQLLNDKLQTEIRAQDDRVQRAQVTQDQIDRYAKWNDLLKRECQEKSAQITRHDELIEFARRLEEENAKLKAELDQVKEASKTSSSQERRFEPLLDQLKELRNSLSSLRHVVENEATLNTKDVLDCLNKAAIMASGVKNVNRSDVETVTSHPMNTALIDNQLSDNVDNDDNLNTVFIHQIP